MKKVPLADVLWEAANRHLTEDEWDGVDSAEFSCWAVDHAFEAVAAGSEPAYELLKGMGCNTQTIHEFGVCRGPERQGVRYMWLLLAMHVAEDEGIMVEVSA